MIPRTGDFRNHIGWVPDIRFIERLVFNSNWRCDPAPKIKKFDDDKLMELIRFVSSHEVEFC
jgi:hypothetical protein